PSSPTSLRLQQEFCDDWGDFRRSARKEKMAVIDYTKRRLRDQGCQNLCVCKRDNRIVSTVQDQRGLTQPVEPRQTGPACSCQQLVGISKSARRFDMLGMAVEKFRVFAVDATIEVRSYFAQKAGIGIAARRH